MSEQMTSEQRDEHWLLGYASTDAMITYRLWRWLRVQHLEWSTDYSESD